MIAPPNQRPDTCAPQPEANRPTIDAEFRALIPLLREDELAQLTLSLQAEGCRDPLVAWASGDVLVLLDGHNRLEICERLGIPYRVEALDLASREAAQLWIELNQLGRRNLSDDQRAMVAASVQQRRAAAAVRAQRQAAGRASARQRNGETTSVSSLTTAPTPRSREVLAGQARVSERRVRQARQLMEANPAAAGAVRAGRLTLREARQAEQQAHKAAVVERLRSEPAPLPQGPYRVLVADPPWAYGKRDGDPSHRGQCPYPSMETTAIAALPVAPLAADDALLWLWTTNAFMAEAHAVSTAWGFEVKTILTWIKPHFGLGEWLRNQTEHCLLAVRGRPVVTLTNQSTLLHAPVGEHSQKPDEFYALVESLCPGSKVELFARRPREGWARWGAEA